jgi:hypothetical protein
LSGRRGGPARRSRRPVVPCGAPAGGKGLLVFERRAVDVAGVTIGLAAEAQDGGVVDEAVGDGHGLGQEVQRSAPSVAKT